MAWPGGSRTPVVESNPHDSKNGASASRSEVLNKFMKLMNSLSLSETETKALTDKLQDLQIEKMSNFVETKLDENEILNLLSKLSDKKVLEGL